MREEIKRLKLIEIQLANGIQELIETRDCLVMEVQNLQEAKPAFERAFTVSLLVTIHNIEYNNIHANYFQRTAHPSLMQRIGQLEQKNRHLQYCLKQQQMYTETMVQRK